MKKTLLRSLAMLLGVAALCFAFPAGMASAAAASTDIPSAYVVYDETNYYLINYENLLDSYMSYQENPDSADAKLAKFYFDTLELGFEGHFIAYVSGITGKYVDYGAILDKYIATESVTETYGWFNSDEATPAFSVPTELIVLGPDGSAQGHVYVDSSGYEQVVPIANPSVETVDPIDSTKPEHWLNGSWGTNSATFTYLSEGHSGSRSVKVEMTNYTDGDAKWYFEPIPLEHRGYMFSDYYRSNVDTNVIVAVDTADGGKVYLDLPVAPASENWTNYKAAFTMPENGVTATIYHLLNKNGWLITDDYRIDLYDLQVELIANPSVETVDPNDSAMPDHWQNNSWGNNSAVFTYLNEGHTGSRSIKVEVTNYVDGDAKWFFEPIPLEHRNYMFSEYYRSSVDTNVIVAVVTTNGETAYLDLPFAPASENWTSYEAAFTMPENGVTVSVYHVLKKNGWLITDDYGIDPYDYVGFDRGLVTLTFDDGWEENTASALPVMQQYGFKSNQFYATTYIENEPTADPELIRLFIDDGHEIGSHSITHPDLTTLSAAEVQHELEGSKQFLEAYFGITIRHFATPYGAYNISVKDSIMTYYDTHRTVDTGYNSKDNFDVSRLKCMSILSTTTASDVEKWVQEAKDEHLWLILLYHRVTNEPGEYDTTPTLFEQHMQVINDADIPVVTISQALAEIESQ